MYSPNNLPPNFLGDSAFCGCRRRCRQGGDSGRAADALARAARLQPRAKVGEGSAALTDASVDVCGGNSIGGGGQ